ncbi:glycosyltransferase family 2 protein [Aestuariivirga litoralis]|uniref:glycosyltransferase family 2 protein n=1 Tax=Aestuariivirga litoralis TaxID=2650924 RepID=UPI001379CFF1|nr:glycosyltransferase family 2 protein [Aestuariivirga litoralis]
MTVYIVNRNYGRFLRQAIESVLVQSHAGLEIVVVDDASEDESAAVLAAFESHPRIRILRNDRVRGLTACCNAAIRESHGRLVMRLDADDFLAPRAIEVLAGAMLREPGAALACCGHVAVDVKGVSLGSFLPRPRAGSATAPDLPPHGACVMVRRRFLDRMGGYDEAIPCQDGLDLWLHVGPEDRVLTVNEPLVHYRQHAGNLSRGTAALMAARGKILAKHVAKRGLVRPRVKAVVMADWASSSPVAPLTPLAGKPLIEWCLDEALGCAGLDAVVLRTSEVEVQRHAARRYGAAVQVEAGESSQAPAQAAAGFDAVLQLDVRSPFLSRGLMQQAIHAMQLFEAGEVLAVQREDGVLLRHDGTGLQSLRDGASVRREEDELYRQCPGLTLLRTQPAPLAGEAARRSHVLLDQAAGFTIRTALDLEFAALMARARLSADADAA